MAETLYVFGTMASADKVGVTIGNSAVLREVGGSGENKIDQ